MSAGRSGLPRRGRRSSATKRGCYAASVPIELDVDRPDAVPYFNQDVAVTNAEVRRALASGDDDERLFWMARILSEARYRDVWRYLSLRRDVVPNWTRLAPMLGRRRAFWEFLLDGWRRDGLLPD